MIRAVALQQYVGRFDVAVDEPARVDMLQRCKLQVTLSLDEQCLLLRDHEPVGQRHLEGCRLAAGRLCERRLPVNDRGAPSKGTRSGAGARMHTRRGYLDAQRGTEGRALRIAVWAAGRRASSATS